VGAGLLEHLPVLLLELLGGVFLDLGPQRVGLGLRRVDHLLGLGLRVGEDLLDVLLDLGREILALFLAAEDLLDLQDGELLLQVRDELGESCVLLDLPLHLGGDGLHVGADLLGVVSREALLELPLPDVFRGNLHKRHPSGPELERHLNQARDQEILQEHDRRDDDDGRQVDTEISKGQPPPHRPQDRLRCPVQELDDGIVGVGVHPGQKGPDDDHPSIEAQRYVKDPGKGLYKIGHKEHRVPF